MLIIGVAALGGVGVGKYLRKKKDEKDEKQYETIRSKRTEKNVSVKTRIEKRNGQCPDRQITLILNSQRRNKLFICIYKKFQPQYQLIETDITLHPTNLANLY